MPQSSEAEKKLKTRSLKLWPEQQAVYKFALQRNATAMLCEQRTGKTYVTLALLRKLAGDPINLTTGSGNNFTGLLVSILTNRDSTWLDGIRQFLPWLNVTSDWEEFKKLPNPRILLIHYEMLPKLINKLCKYHHFNWACVDEAQRISNRGNKASRAMARLNWIDRRVVLTGTPQEVRETDYFGIFRFLDPSVFGKNWARFEKRYMTWPVVDFENAPPGSAKWQKKTLQQRILKNKAKFREDRRQEFIDLLKPHCIRLTKEDVGIKEAKAHKVLVDMTTEQRRCYTEMLRNGFFYLKKGNKRKPAKVVASLTITNIAKRRQIATGFVYDERDRLHDLGDNKMKKTIKLVERLPKPLVVFTAFRPDNDLVYETLYGLGYDVAQVNGSVPRKKSDRARIWRDFQRAQYDVAVVQTRTGGTGVDLWKANNAIVYSMTHSFRDFDQLKSRLDSRSKSRPSEFYVLCSRNSIDEDLYDLVIVKRFNVELTLKHLKQGAKTWQRQPRKKLRQRSGCRPNAKSPSTASLSSPKRPA